MLLNKLPCLDKGYVAYLDSTCDSVKLRDVALEFFKRTDGKFLQDLAHLTVVIKCPLFVQLNLSQFDLNIVVTPGSDDEAYCPSVGEIGSPDHATNKAIADDFERTTAALQVNPKAYQADGCDRFISQVMTPISTYTTLIVAGSYNEWRKFVNQPNMPAPLIAYTNAVHQIMTMEWK
jgi:hypothetical protein